MLPIDRRYQVFVSSTYNDLIEERQQVMQALLELDCIPAGMELFPAADDDQWTLIKSVIDESDYYLVIIAGRYGSRSKDGISYTQKEYEYALAQKKPTIAFLHKDPASLSSSKTEPTDEGKEQLIAFREFAQKKMCKYWTTADELGSVASRSLIKLIKHKPGIGWIRGDEKTEPYYDALEQSDKLFKEREELQKQIHELQQRIGDAPKEVFNDFDAAWPTIEKRLLDIISSSENGEKLKLRILGVCLHKSFPRLENFLLTSDLRGVRMEIRLGILDDESEVWSNFDEKWNGLRSAFNSNLARLVDLLTRINAEDNLTGNISIKLHKYGYMPNYHGVMLNKKEVFMSLANWDSDRFYKANHNTYEYYQNDVSDLHKMKVTLFRRWFDYGRYNYHISKSEQLIFDSEFPA